MEGRIYSVQTGLLSLWLLSCSYQIRRGTIGYQTSFRDSSIDVDAGWDYEGLRREMFSERPSGVLNPGRRLRT
jgi:hypothetical protein